MKDYHVTLTGLTPLLMHYDNIEWADRMEAWKNDPTNKRSSRAGDDRTPAWRWLGCCYHDGARLVIPQANIMRAIMEGGAMVPVPGAKGGKTFKAQTQSGMMSEEANWPLFLAGGNPVAWPDLERLTGETTFGDIAARARALGFDLLVKRAKIGNNKHVRVRPQFGAGWTVAGHIKVWDDQITAAVLLDILNYAGQYKGLGDWRPGGKTPGPYGRFEATLKKC